MNLNAALADVSKCPRYTCIMEIQSVTGVTRWEEAQFDDHLFAFYVIMPHEEASLVLATTIEIRDNTTNVSKRFPQHKNLLTRTEPGDTVKFSHVLELFS